MNQHKRAHKLSGAELHEVVNSDSNSSRIDSDYYSLYSITNEKERCPRVEVGILGSCVEFGIDTQASLNALSKESYLKMGIRPKLIEDQSKVFSYDGLKPIKSLGKFNAVVSFKNRTVEAEFSVLEGVRDNLLSHKTSLELDLIKITCSVGDQDAVFHNNMVEKFPKLFSGKIGCLKDYQVKFHINENVKPVIQKERKIPFHLKDKIEKAIDDLLDDDIIEPVCGEPTLHVSCFVAVPKPSNPDELRITLDSKVINNAILRERHNMPNLEELMVKLNGAKYLSKLDLKGGYHQIMIDKNSRFITVFRTPKGLMRYKRLVMGISCASEMFQFAIENALDGLIGAINLIDDIFVWGTTEEEHDRNLLAVLERLESKGLTVSPGKCSFKKTELEFFGIKFTQEGIQITEEKVKALREAKLPVTQSELRSFLGLANFCSNSIPLLAVNSIKLWQKTHKKQPKCLKWMDEEVKQFEMVSKDSILTEALSYFNKNWHTVLEVDASPVGAGAVLYQVDPYNEKNKKIVRFWSKSFSDVEQRYAQVEKEAYAIVLACEKFKYYLIGNKFTLFTDNKAVELIYRNPKSNPPARIRRFNLRLMDYNFDINHKPGELNIADYLSRHPIYSKEINRDAYLAEQFLYFTCINNKPRVLSMEELIDESLKDEMISKVKAKI